MVLNRDAGCAPVLWAVPVGHLAGVARHVLDAAAVGIPGWRLVVLCPPGPLADRLEAAGTRVLRDRFGPQFGAARSARSLRTALEEVRPRVLHTHLAYADLLGAWARTRRRDLRLVSTEHGIARDDTGFHGGRRRARAMAALHSRRLARTDAQIAVSAATAEAIREKWHPPAEPVVIRNGRDPARRTPHPATRVGPPRVLSLARLAPEKRLPELIDAFAVLHRREPGATLTLAGTGDLATTLTARAAERGVAAAVRLPGHVEAADALADADVLALVSRWENCPYALLDALDHGVGCVGAPVGGIPEILPPHCLATPSDPEVLAHTLAEQAAEPQRRPSDPVTPEWPTRSQMTAAVAEVYARLIA